MSVRSPTKLLTPVQLTTTATDTSYTVPTGYKLIGITITLVNTDTAGAYLGTVYFIASGGSASTSNILTYQKSLAAKETFTLPDTAGHVLNAGDKIQAIADTAAKINFHASGTLVPA